MENKRPAPNFFTELHNRLVQEGLLNADLEVPALHYQSRADSVDSWQADQESYLPVSYNDWWNNLSACWSLSDGGRRILSWGIHDLLVNWFNGLRDGKPLQHEVHPADVVRVVSRLMSEGSAVQTMATRFAQAITTLLAQDPSLARSSNTENTSNLEGNKTTSPQGPIPSPWCCLPLSWLIHLRIQPFLGHLFDPDSPKSTYFTAVQLVIPHLSAV